MLWPIKVQYCTADKHPYCAPLCINPASSCPARCVHQVRRHTIRCEFKVHCDTQLGDHVMVVGSHPALGSWDAEHGGALALSQLSGERGVWSGIMSLDWPLKDYSSKMVSFKVGGAGDRCCFVYSACLCTLHSLSAGHADVQPLAGAA